MKKGENLMYTLYHDRKEHVIKISKAKKVLQKLDYTDEVKEFNHCYYFCSLRAPLVAKANALKQSWITDLEDELNLVKAITF